MATKTTKETEELENKLRNDPEIPFRNNIKSVYLDFDLDTPEDKETEGDMYITFDLNMHTLDIPLFNFDFECGDSYYVLISELLEFASRDIPSFDYYRQLNRFGEVEVFDNEVDKVFIQIVKEEEEIATLTFYISEFPNYYVFIYFVEAKIEEKIAELEEEMEDFED